MDRRADEIRALVEDRYSQLGAVREVSRQESEAVTSNEHYFVETDGGRFFLKQLERADSLYGAGGIDRLRWVCRAIHELGSRGLLVERIVPTADGEHLVDDRGTVVRIYQVVQGRPFAGSDADTAAAAEAAGRFHREAAAALGPETTRALRAFEVPYPLRRTRASIDAIQHFVETFTGPPEERAACDHVAERFGFLRACLEKTGDILGEEPSGQCLVHADLHPDNVLYAAGGEAVLIDLDNVMFEAPLRCTAFSILRFALMASPAEPLRRLREVTALWRQGYEAGFGEPFGPGLEEWMIFLELEKVLRILERKRSTGGYGHFLPNIASRHLPNLELLMGFEAGA